MAYPTACSVPRGLGAGNRAWLPDQYGIEPLTELVRFEAVG